MHEARDALQRAVTLDPTSSTAWFALGLTFQDLLNEGGAAAAFEAALRERPGLAEAAVNLGIALQRQGDMTAAMAAYRRAIAILEASLGPESVESARGISNLGALLRDLARYGEAEALLRTSLAVYQKSLGESHPGTIASIDLRHHHADLIELCRANPDRATLERANLTALAREIHV